MPIVGTLWLMAENLIDSMHMPHGRLLTQIIAPTSLPLGPMAENRIDLMHMPHGRLLLNKTQKIAFLENTSDICPRSAQGAPEERPNTAAHSYI